MAPTLNGKTAEAYPNGKDSEWDYLTGETDTAYADPSERADAGYSDIKEALRENGWLYTSGEVSKYLAQSEPGTQYREPTAEYQDPNATMQHIPREEYGEEYDPDGTQEYLSNSTDAEALEIISETAQIAFTIAAGV